MNELRPRRVEESLMIDEIKLHSAPVRTTPQVKKEEKLLFILCKAITFNIYKVDTFLMYSHANGSYSPCKEHTFLMYFPANG